jgi:hypothetical protein
MAQVVSLRYLTVEARVRIRFSASGICGGQNGTGEVFLELLRFIPINTIPLWLPTLVYRPGINNGPVGGHRSETRSCPTAMNNMNKKKTYVQCCNV